MFVLFVSLFVSLFVLVFVLYRCRRSCGADVWHDEFYSVNWRRLFMAIPGDGAGAAGRVQTGASGCGCRRVWVPAGAGLLQILTRGYLVAARGVCP